MIPALFAVGLTLLIVNFVRWRGRAVLPLLAALFNFSCYVIWIILRDPSTPVRDILGWSLGLMFIVLGVLVLVSNDSRKN